MKPHRTLQSLLALAREHEPFGEPRPLGFETRLRARLREASPSLADWIARLSWRVSLICYPVLIAIGVVLLTTGSPVLPEGAGGVVAHWSSYLPLEH